MYGLHGCIATQPGKTEVVLEHLLKASKVLEGAKGLHLYMVSIPEGKENMVTVTEMWDTKEDHDASLKIDGVMEIIKSCYPYLNMSEGSSKTELNVKGGVGVPKQK
eukprot:gene7177-11489_t